VDRRADGQTDITKLTVAFRNSVTGHKHNRVRGTYEYTSSTKSYDLKAFLLTRFSLVTGHADSLSTVFS